MEQDLQEKAVAYLNAHDLPESISTFPTIIRNKAILLSNLERQIDEAQKKANEAQEATNKMNGYEDKEIKIGKWNIFKWKSGDTKKIMEETQDVVKLQTDAATSNAKALELSFQFEKELASTTEFLFYLGCYNIATVEAMIADLNEQLKKEITSNNGQKIKLSSKTKELFKSVIKRLSERQDVLYRQEKLKEKSKRHGQAIARNIQQLEELEKTLKEKEELDAAQSALIEDIRMTLEEKNRIDDEQSNKIERLLDSMKDKDELDKKQSEQIENVTKHINKMYEDFSAYNKKQTKMNRIVGFIAIAGFMLGLVAILLEILKYNM